MDIPAILALSDMPYLDNTFEWDRFFIYSAWMILEKYNKLIIDGSKRDSRRDHELISKLLTPHRAYIVKHMMLTQSVFLPGTLKNRNASIFTRLFGEHKTEFKSRPYDNYPPWEFDHVFNNDPSYFNWRNFGAKFKANMSLLPTNNGLCGVFNANPYDVYSEAKARGDYHRAVHAQVSKLRLYLRTFST